ncbi:VOC family protein (plasmid) [Thioclava sp. 'Guangxiensis']|uniref:VOC family protein n=1 Tax=Thioclava sp. 'Guangxiensis' TaxID=3149044 RepID=UPI0032C4991B
MSTPSPRQANFRGIEHVGITVPDHAQAVKFFEDVFGAEVMFSLTDKSRDPLPASALGPKNGLRSGRKIVAVSTMRFGNGANMEIFEIDQPDDQPRDNIANLGINHISVTVDDIDAASDAFAKAGGELLEGPYDLSDQEEGRGNRGRFGFTPWGMLIEFEQLPAPMSYDNPQASERLIPDPRRATQEV